MLNINLLSFYFRNCPKTCPRCEKKFSSVANMQKHYKNVQCVKKVVIAEVKLQ